MRVIFRQSGGFAGLIEGCELDTARLPSKEAARLRALVKRSRPHLARPVTTGRRSEARDLCCYEITIHADDAVHHRSFDEMSLPKGASALVAYLRKHARP